MEQKPQEQVATPAPAPQPTTPWPETPPENAKVQYVVAHESLEGIGGWLMFWLIVFALNGLGNASLFFVSLSSGFSSGATILAAIMSPIIAAGAIATVIFIAMRKKLAIKLAVATLGVVLLNSIISLIINNSDGYTSISLLIGSIVAQLLFTGLVALYFFTSKRVKQTLIN